jgi:tRNA(Ile)-lysidine synthetase-like protein
MKADGFLPVPEYAHIPLRRPLLGMTREEIVDFAQEHSLPWREDSTNCENGYKRNKIRNLVFPVFKEINPSFVRTLNRDMARFSETYESGKTISSSADENFSRLKNAVEKFCPTPENEIVLLEFTIREEPWCGTNEVKQEQGHLIMDACKIGAVPVFSYWKEGDWIRPLGAPGKKKLQDWFTDHHVPVEFKHLIPLVRDPEDESHILAIAGCCIDKKVKVGPATTKIYRIDPIEE